MAFHFFILLTTVASIVCSTSGHVVKRSVDDELVFVHTVCIVIKFRQLILFSPFNVNAHFLSSNSFISAVMVIGIGTKRPREAGLPARGLNAFNTLTSFLNK